MPLTLSGTNGVSGIDGTAGTPTERGSDADTGVFYPSAGNIAISTNGTEALRVDSSQNVGIGTASPSTKLHISGGLRVADSTNSANYIVVGSGNEAPIGANSVVSQTGNLVVGTVAASTVLQFATNGSERARIDSSGNLLVGQSSTTTPGLSNTTNGSCLRGIGDFFLSVSGTPPFQVNRNTNDGVLVSLRQDGTQEGDISVSGSTVSYNGGHLSRWSQPLDGHRDPSILKGTLMSNLDAMCVWEKDGQILLNEQLNRMKISDVEGDINVAGVFVNWDNDDTDNPYDMNIAMTGDMIIRIADDVVVQKGDLLMSAGDGTAKPQGDDIVRSKTIAKVTSNHVTCTYDDGSYCVPCVLMAC